MPEATERAATWKCVAALLLDFCTVGFGGGYLIALSTGETTGRGFHLHGASALALWALFVIYFFVGWRYAGGTLWDRIFRIGRPQPGDVETPRKSSDQSAGARAGFWRRGLALSIDTIIISVLFQLIVAVLFIATSGRIQIYGDVTYTSCSKRETIPDGLTPPPPARADIARECNISFLGAQTARILQVGPGTKEGTIDVSASQSYMLDREGYPFDGVPVDWIAMLALIAYLIVMETRTGATLGSRAMRICVIDAAAPDGPGVPLSKIVMRYLAMMIGCLPILAGLLIYFGLYGSFDELYTLFLSLSRGDMFNIEAPSGKFEWHPFLGAYLLSLPGLSLGDGSPSFDKIKWLLDSGALLLNAWAIFLIIQIARKSDPLYDQIAGTAVVRVLHDHQRSDAAAL